MNQWTKRRHFTGDMGRYESYVPQKGSSEVRVFTFWLVHQEYVRYEAVQNNLARNRNLTNSLPIHSELHYMRVNIYCIVDIASNIEMPRLSYFTKISGYL